MTNFTKEEFDRMLKNNSQITSDIQPSLFGGSQQTREATIPEIQIELPISNNDLFHRLNDHRELERLETFVQSEYIKWVRTNKMYVEPLRACFAIPNGGSRPKKTAATMKAEGMEAGVPDLMILSPARSYAGLVIETKTKYNQPSMAQKNWLNMLSRNNFYCVVCWSTIDMVNVTCWFYTFSDEVKHRWPL